MKLKTVKRIALALLALAVLLVILVPITRQAAFGFAAIGVTLVYVVVLSVFYRCPNCGRSLGRLNDKIKYCPFCAHEIDMQ